MDYLWTPWRYAYIKSADSTSGCVFCRILEAGADPEADRKNWILYRGAECFVILNSYPYNSGHVMVLPYAHLDELGKLPASAAHEMMDLCQKVEAVLRKVYRPDGVNLGMNMGKAAGAGVAGHIHMHLLPRWVADSNFMTVVGETRVLPETLEQTWKRLKAALGR
jgi:ATP adenylyltransferase